jgi:hypothetical protein
MSAPDLTTTMPDGWITASPLLAEPLAEARCPDGVVVLATMCLCDGTNFFTLTWPTGQRVARAGDATGWGIQEQYDGDQPTGDEDVRSKLWSKAMTAFALSLRETREEMGGLPS